MRAPVYAVAALLAGFAMATDGCEESAPVRAKIPPPPSAEPSVKQPTNASKIAVTPENFTETGIAAWYGKQFDGHRTASGELFEDDYFTAAHRTLPFDTWVEVTNLKNGKHVDVRINDRGPFTPGRIIDLSRAAAEQIDLVRLGSARVRVRRILASAQEP